MTQSATQGPAAYGDLEVTADELKLIDDLDELRLRCNSMEGHDWQRTTYGAVSKALIAAIAQAFRNAAMGTPAAGHIPATPIARTLFATMVASGERFEFALQLMREGRLEWDGFVWVEDDE